MHYFEYVQYPINLHDFQDAEPDALVHSTSAIIEHFSEKGIRCNVALKALCKKKGLNVEVKRISAFRFWFSYLISVEVYVFT